MGLRGAWSGTTMRVKGKAGTKPALGWWGGGAGVYASSIAESSSSRLSLVHARQMQRAAHVSVNPPSFL